MSARNRPRGAIAKEDLTDELNLWTSILEKLRKAQALNDKYEDVAAKIAAAEQPIEGDDRMCLPSLQVRSGSEAVIQQEMKKPDRRRLS